MNLMVSPLTLFNLILQVVSSGLGSVLIASVALFVTWKFHRPPTLPSRSHLPALGCVDNALLGIDTSRNTVESMHSDESVDPGPETFKELRAQMSLLRAHVNAELEAMWRATMVQSRGATPSTPYLSAGGSRSFRQREGGELLQLPPASPGPVAASALGGQQPSDIIQERILEEIARINRRIDALSTAGTPVQALQPPPRRGSADAGSASGSFSGAGSEPEQASSGRGLPPRGGADMLALAAQIQQFKSHFESAVGDVRRLAEEAAASAAEAVSTALSVVADNSRGRNAAPSPTPEGKKGSKRALSPPPPEPGLDAAALRAIVDASTLSLRHELEGEVGALASAHSSTVAEVLSSVSQMRAALDSEVTVMRERLGEASAAALGAADAALDAARQSTENSLASLRHELSEAFGHLKADLSAEIEQRIAAIPMPTAAPPPAPPTDTEPAVLGQLPPELYAQLKDELTSELVAELAPELSAVRRHIEGVNSGVDTLGRSLREELQARAALATAGIRTAEQAVAELREQVTELARARVEQPDAKAETGSAQPERPSVSLADVEAQGASLRAEIASLQAETSALLEAVGENLGARVSALEAKNQHENAELRHEIQLAAAAAAAKGQVPRHGEGLEESLRSDIASLRAELESEIGAVAAGVQTTVGQIQGQLAALESTASVATALRELQDASLLDLQVSSDALRTELRARLEALEQRTEGLADGLSAAAESHADLVGVITELSTLRRRVDEVAAGSLEAAELASLSQASAADAAAAASAAAASFSAAPQPQQAVESKELERATAELRQDLEVIITSSAKALEAKISEVRVESGRSASARAEALLREVASRVDALKADVKARLDEVAAETDSQRAGLASAVETASAAAALRATEAMSAWLETEAPATVGRIVAGNLDATLPSIVAELVAQGVATEIPILSRQILGESLQSEIPAAVSRILPALLPPILDDLVGPQVEDKVSMILPAAVEETLARTHASEGAMLELSDRIELLHAEVDAAREDLGSQVKALQAGVLDLATAVASTERQGGASFSVDDRVRVTLRALHSRVEGLQAEVDSRSTVDALLEGRREVEGMICDLRSEFQEELSDIRSQLASLPGQLFESFSGMDSKAARGSVDQDGGVTLTALRGEVAALRHMVNEAEASTQRRVDEAMRRGADARRALVDQVAAHEKSLRSLSELPAELAVVRRSLEGRVDDLSDQVASITSGAADSAAVRDLQAAIREVQRALASVAAGNPYPYPDAEQGGPHVSDRIAALEVAVVELADDLAVLRAERGDTGSPRDPDGPSVSPRVPGATGRLLQVQSDILDLQAALQGEVSRLEAGLSAAARDAADARSAVDSTVSVRVTSLADSVRHLDFEMQQLRADVDGAVAKGHLQSLADQVLELHSPGGPLGDDSFMGPSRAAAAPLDQLPMTPRTAAGSEPLADETGLAGSFSVPLGMSLSLGGSGALPSPRTLSQKGAGPRSPLGSPRGISSSGSPRTKPDSARKDRSSEDRSGSGHSAPRVRPGGVEWNPANASPEDSPKLADPPAHRVAASPVVPPREHQSPYTPSSYRVTTISANESVSKTVYGVPSNLGTRKPASETPRASPLYAEGRAGESSPGTTKRPASPTPARPASQERGRGPEQASTGASALAATPTLSLLADPSGPFNSSLGRGPSTPQAPGPTPPPAPHSNLAPGSRPSVRRELLPSPGTAGQTPKPTKMVSEVESVVLEAKGVAGIAFANVSVPPPPTGAVADPDAHRRRIVLRQLQRHGIVAVANWPAGSAAVFDWKRQVRISADLEGHEGLVRCVALAPPVASSAAAMPSLAMSDPLMSRLLLATGGEDGSVFVFDWSTGERLAELRGHTAAVSCVAFCPDALPPRPSKDSGGPATYLASTSSDKTLIVWDWALNEPLSQLEHPAAVHLVAFSCPGAQGGPSWLLATAAADGVVRAFDWKTGRQLSSMRLVAPAACIAFSPNHPGLLAVAGGSPAVAGADALVWDCVQGRFRAALTGHRDAVNSVAWSPRWDNLLATASFDGTARLFDWRAEGGAVCLAVLQVGEPVLSVAFSPCGGLSPFGGGAAGTVSDQSDMEAEGDPWILVTWSTRLDREGVNSSVRVWRVSGVAGAKGGGRGTSK